MSRVTKIVVSLTALAAIVGCGGDSGSDKAAGQDQENAVRFVMADLQAASRDGDGERICNRIFTPKLADSVTAASESGSCAKEVETALFSPQVRIVVEDVNVADPTNATALVREQNGKSSRVLLAKQGGEWRVRSVEPG